MPRRVVKFTRRRVWQADELDEELALCLVAWEGCLGADASLRTRSDWAAAWSRWGERILPEFVARHPGCRPAAMYAAGLVPAVPLLRSLPVDVRSRGYFVADGDGGVSHWRLSERYQRCEASWLLEQGVIDRAEYRRHLRSGFGHAWRCT